MLQFLYLHIECFSDIHNMYINVFIYIYMQVYIYIYVHVYTYTCNYVLYIYICHINVIYIYIYSIYTHICNVQFHNPKTSNVSGHSTILSRKVIVSFLKLPIVPRHQRQRGPQRQRNEPMFSSPSRPSQDACGRNRSAD